MKKFNLTFFFQPFVNPWDELNSLLMVGSLSAHLPALCTLADVITTAVDGKGEANIDTNGIYLLEHTVSLCSYSAAIASALHLVYEVSCVCVCVCCMYRPYMSVDGGAKLSFIIGYEA